MALDDAVLQADSVDAGHVNPVGDGVRALNGLPGRVLRRAKLIFFSRMPANRGGIEDRLGAFESGQPCGLRVPLIPADQRAHAAKSGVDSLKTQVAGRKIVLFVEERVVGNVHLAINPGDSAIGIQGDGRVVIEPRRAALEERGDDGHPQLPRQFGELGRRGPWNGLGQIEEARLLALAEVLGAEKLRQADDVRPQPRRLADVAERGGKVGLRVGAHAHLHQPDIVFTRLCHKMPAFLFVNGARFGDQGCQTRHYSCTSCKACKSGERPGLKALRIRSLSGG